MRRGLLLLSLLVASCAGHVRAPARLQLEPFQIADPKDCNCKRFVLKVKGLSTDKVNPLSQDESTFLICIHPIGKDPKAWPVHIIEWENGSPGYTPDPDDPAVEM